MTDRPELLLDLTGDVRACRSCGNLIRWSTTSRGTRIPLDAHPNPTGNIEYRPQAGGPGQADVLTKAALAAARARGATLYLTHFATCPNADQHRRR